MQRPNPSMALGAGLLRTFWCLTVQTVRKVADVPVRATDGRIRWRFSNFLSPGGARQRGKGRLVLGRKLLVPVDLVCTHLLTIIYKTLDLSNDN